MFKNSIYVAATSQHIGKTTSTLGLVHALRAKKLSVGYCKPVGQEFLDIGDLRVDKDALLFSTVMHFELDSKVHSPVILGRGATSQFLDRPDDFDYKQRIISAAEILHQRNDLVVYEGTGHPGVGSVVGLSNADVAKLLNAKVIMIVEGGIGNTIDRLNLCLSIFQQKKVPVIGVIINKVIAKKRDAVKHYVGKYLKQINLPLLGVLPYDETLSQPIMETIRRAIDGQVIFNATRLYNKVENFVSGSLIEETGKLRSFNNQLLVVSYKRIQKALDKIEEITLNNNQKRSPLSGIIVTGDGRLDQPAIDYLHACLPYIEKHKIPVVSTSLDTLGSVYKISRIEVKINTKTPWKTKRAIQLIENHVNLEKILGEVVV